MSFRCRKYSMQCTECHANSSMQRTECHSSALKIIKDLYSLVSTQSATHNNTVNLLQQNMLAAHARTHLGAHLFLFNCSVWHSAQVYCVVLRFRLLFWQAGQREHICGLHSEHNQVFNCSTSVGKALFSNATMGSLQSLRSRRGCRHTLQVWQSGAIHLGRQHSLHKVR